MRNELNKMERNIVAEELSGFCVEKVKSEMNYK